MNPHRGALAAFGGNAFFAILRILKSTGLALAAASLALAAAPEVGFVFPAGGQRGQTVAVTVGSDAASQPTRAWTDHPELLFQAADTNGQFTVRIGHGVPTGPHLTWFYNLDGVSAPRLFVVGEAPEIILTNTILAAPETALASHFPITINGRLREISDVLTNRVVLATNEEFRAELVAYAIDSPLAAKLTLLDPAGRIVGESTNLPPHDPTLQCAITLPGVHQLLLRLDADYARRRPAFAGGDAAVFRLTLSAAPRADATVTTLLPGRDDRILVDSPPLPDRPYRLVVRKAPEPEITRIQRPVVQWPSLNLPGTVTGFIAPSGDEDWYSFQAAAQELHRFRAKSTVADSGFTPRLRILDTQGAVQAESVSGTETSLEWIAAQGGQYYIVMTDASGAGAPNFRYELEASAPEPHLGVSLDEDRFRIAPGSAVTPALRLVRPDADQRQLVILAPDLPPGASLTPLPVLPGANQAGFVLRAAIDAPATNRPFQVFVSDPSRIPPHLAIARAPIRGRFAAPGDLLTNETDTLWLTVLPAR